VGYSVWPQDDNNPFRVQYLLESSGSVSRLVKQAGMHINFVIEFEFTQFI